MTQSIQIVGVVGMPPYVAGLTLRCRWRVDPDIAARAAGEPIRVSSHVSDERGEVVLWEGPRSLPIPASDADHAFLVPVDIPRAPGRYDVALDPVVELKFWASTFGFEPVSLRVERLRGGQLRPTLPDESESDGHHERQDARSTFFRLAGAFTPLLAVDTDVARIILNTSDLVISQTIFVERTFDDEITLVKAVRVLERLLESWKPDKTFLDIGSNIGTTTLAALLKLGFPNAMAFEADPENYAYLQLNISANNLSDRCLTMNVALSDSVGNISLERDTINRGDHRIRVQRPDRATSTPDMFYEELRDVVQVPAVTFDHLVSAGSLNLDDVALVWMDTQGHEGHVLRGARQLTPSNIPVVAEYWPYGLERSGGLQMIDEIIRDAYTHFVDLGEPQSAHEAHVRRSGDVSQLRERYAGDEHTDLLLLKL